MSVFEHVEELKELTGQEIGISGWLQIDQQRVDQFAEATGDHQWIHVDTERATRELPTRGTIVHGYLVLSLMTKFMDDCLQIGDVKSGINYGCNKVRFISMVPTGSKLRARMTVNSFAEKAGGFQVAFGVTIEMEGQDNPVCVAETIGVFYT